MPIPKSIESALKLARIGQFTEAFLLLDNLIGTLRQSQRVEQISCLNALSYCLWMSGQSSEALKRAEDALRLSEQDPPHIFGKAEAFYHLGMISKARGDCDQAQEYCKQSLTLRKEIRDAPGTSDSMHSLGLIYEIRGELDQAEHCYMESLSIAEELNYHWRIAVVMGNLGNIHRARGDPIKAEGFFRKKIALLDQIGYHRHAGSSCDMLVEALVARGALEEASIEVDRLEQLAEESDDPQICCAYHWASGLLKLKQHNLTTALEHAWKAKWRAAEHPFFDMQISVVQLLVQILLELYLLTRESEYKTQVETLIKELEDISKKKRLNQVYVKTLLMSALMKKATFNLSGAFEQLKNANKLAAECGMLPLAQKARKELNNLQEQMRVLQQLQEMSPESYEHSQMHEMLSYLKDLQRDFRQSSL